MKIGQEGPIQQQGVPENQLFGRGFGRTPFGNSDDALHRSLPCLPPQDHCHPLGVVDGRLRPVRLGQANAVRQNTTTVDPNSEMSLAIVRSFRRPRKGPEMIGPPACDISRRTIDHKASVEALQYQFQTSVELRQRILGKRTCGTHNNMLEDHGSWPRAVCTAL